LLTTTGSNKQRSVCNCSYALTGKTVKKKSQQETLILKPGTKGCKTRKPLVTGNLNLEPEGEIYYICYILSKHIFTLCFGIFYFFSNLLNAQFSRFKHLTVDEGLTNNLVYAITQDSKGFIWAGTEYGINRYDGYKITKYPYNAEDSTGISAAQVRCLFADNDKLWIGTFKGGLSCLNLLTNKFSIFLPDSQSKNSIASDVVNAIAGIDENTLALGTAKGLNLFDKRTNTFRLVSHSDKDENSLLADNIRSVTKDKNGNLWIAHYNYGLTQYNIKTGNCIRHIPGKDNRHLSVLNIRSVFADSDDLLWISNWQNGLSVLDIKTGVFSYNHDTSSKFMKNLQGLGLIFSFYEDRDKNIWFSTAETGICRYNKKTGEKIFFKNNPDDPESFGDNTAFTVFEDKTGIIWAGTWHDGLNYFSKKSLLFGYFKHEKNTPNTLSDKNVHCFTDVGNNEVLIGTGLTFSSFNTATKKFTPFKINKNDNQSILEQTKVTGILKDIDGSVWMSSNGGGVYRYFPDKKKFKNYNVSPDPNSLSHHTPLKMILDNSNNLWIGTLTRGINLFNRGKNNFTRFLHDPGDQKSIPTNDLFYMVKDKHGMIWLATETHGLVMLNPEKKEFSVVYNPVSKTSPQGLGVTYIYIDEDGFFWMVTTDGLLKFNPDTYQAENYSEKNPALKKSISGMTEDDLGNLWITCENELLRYNKKTENVTAFYPEDGTQGKEFYRGSELKLKDGRLFLGGTNGFNFFDPETIKEDKTPPVIALTDFQVLNKPCNLPQDISFTKNIVLSYLDYFFSVDFAAMDFSNPSQNRFKYKLVGFNDEWVDIGSQHSITFTNLDPGNYVLNIKAANNSGHWNETPLQLSITITPPFWRTTWFYFLCIFAGLFLMYALIKYREKQLKKEKNILETKVKERTEELNVEKHKVEEAHKDMRDSIFYAKRIQSAVIPSEEDLKKLLPGSFILFKPKDIVSGDFYWLTEKEDYIFYAVADCTGHGVPGGFMTMLGNGLLNEIVNEHHVTEPAEILNKLRDKIITSLKQTGKSGENKDGMDIVLFRINKKTNELCYAAANNGFIIVNNGIATEYNGDKQPVGIYGDEIKPFRQFNVQLHKGDSLYSFTDGYPDQFGGPKGKKFKYKALNELLVSIAHLDGYYQQEKLEAAFNAWRGDLEQVDDVCIIGIKI
jgi:ligand-binding sensor domain-containing protein/serine phosphatase RsbU (regulator of sigma subunit)